VYPNCKAGNGAQLQGSGFEGHAASSWLVNQANVPPGGLIYLRIAIWDSSDGILDSTALLDAFEWSPLTVDGAVNATEETPIPAGGSGGAGGSGQGGSTSGIFGGSGGAAGEGGSSGLFGGSAGSGGSSTAGSSSGGTGGASGVVGPCPDGSCAAAGQCCLDPATSTCGTDFSGVLCF
jgi:hypothetical protein